MKKIVIYYSKTGNSKRVAEKIGNNLGKSCKNPLHFNEEMNCSCFLQKKLTICNVFLNGTCACTYIYDILYV